MFGLFDAWMKREAYAIWCKSEWRRRQPAKERGLTECVMCGYCCARRTCVPRPDELAAIARHLGLTIDELIAQYMVGDDQGYGFFLRFANKAQEDITGKFLPPSRTYDMAECILFNGDKGCLIYPVRPADARKHTCWKKDEGEPETGQSWPEGKLQEICPGMDLWEEWEEW